MRETFFHRLTVYAFVAFLASLLISCFLENSNCRRELKREIISKISDSNGVFLNVEKTALLLRNANIINAEIDALTVARLVMNDPTILQPDSSKLEDISKKFQFAEIAFVASDGVVDGSWPEDYVGRNACHDENLIELKDALDSPVPRVAPTVDERVDFANSNALELVVVASRMDKKGVVVIKKRNHFNLASQNVVFSSNSFDEKIGRSGRLCFFPKSKQTAQLSTRNNQESSKNFLNPDSLPDNTTSFRIFDGRLNLLYKHNTPLGAFVGWIPYHEIFKSRIHVLSLICFCNFVVLLVIFSLASLFVQKLFVDSIYSINASLHKITAGNLNEKVHVSSSKEFVELCDGVNSTVDSLKKAAEEVKRQTEKELALARKIQLASLPKLEKIYTRHQIFDVYARAVLPAGVGGDMYDFFFIDDDDVVFYIADVAGRGVAASLVMMKTMALVKNYALQGHDLATIITLVNRYLQDGDVLPFVSGIFFMLNLKTGAMNYINAGHIPPILRKKGENCAVIDAKKQLVLGLDPNITYTSVSTTIAPGDMLLVYTDGFLGSGKMTLDDFFATSQALDKLNSLPEASPSQIFVQTFLDAVLAKTDASRPPDDVSILCFRFLAPKTQKGRRSQDSEALSPCKYPEDAIRSSLHNKS